MLKDKENLVNKIVTIRCKDNMYNGKHGTIRDFDGNLYTIKLFKPYDNVELKLFRDDFKVSDNTSREGLGFDNIERSKKRR